MANQTPKERRIYQRERTKQTKATDEAARTPEIINLQRRESALDRAGQVAMRQKNHKRLKRIKAQYKEVATLLVSLIKQPPRKYKI